jgi:DeoR family transcriptional regulator of aga operon
MLAEERRRAILEIMGREGRVLVRELADRFNTSHVTIRNDLKILHTEGLIQRAHGGGLPAGGGTLIDPSLKEKESLHQEEKRRIGDAAAAMVQEGQSVLLDSGTTTTSVARALRQHRNLTVITNAVNIAAELAPTPMELILTGGILRERSFSLVGPLAEETLRQLQADVLFIGVDGFDVDYGLTTPNLLEAKVNRVMVEISRRVVMVCDSSKFGRRSLCLISPPGSIDEIITDSGIAKSELRSLEKAGIKVTVA